MGDRKILLAEVCAIAYDWTASAVFALSRSEYKTLERWLSG
ncbi:MAG: hypothetical protein AB4040_10340 [Synechococcus sp.]